MNINTIVPILVALLVLVPQAMGATVAFYDMESPNGSTDPLAFTTDCDSTDYGADLSFSALGVTNGLYEFYGALGNPGRAMSMYGFVEVNSMNFSMVMTPGKVLNLTGVRFDSCVEVGGPTSWRLLISTSAYPAPFDVIAQGSLASGATWTEIYQPLSATNLTTDSHFRIRLEGLGATDSNAHWLVDNYRIEGDVVPEPATMGLLALGACLPLLRRRR